MSLKNGERCRTQTTPSCADNTSSGLLATARKKKTQHETLTIGSMYLSQRLSGKEKSLTNFQNDSYSRVGITK